MQNDPGPATDDVPIVRLAPVVVQANDTTLTSVAAIRLHHLSASRKPLAPIGLNENTPVVAEDIGLHDDDSGDDIGLVHFGHIRHRCLRVPGSRKYHLPHMHLGPRTIWRTLSQGLALALLALFVLAGCASSQSSVEGADEEDEPVTETSSEPADEATETDDERSDEAEPDTEPDAEADADDDESPTWDSADSDASAEDEDGESEPEEAPEPPAAGADRTTQYAHVEDFDLEFKNARINMAAAELLFDELGDGDDIPDSFDNLLEAADHDLRFDDVSPIVEAELPADLGDAMGIFVLLSSKYGLIGCEAYLRGQDGQDWNDNLFGYLLEQAADLPTDQRNNQAGLLVIGSNAVSAQLCPRLQSHT